MCHVQSHSRKVMYFTCSQTTLHNYSHLVHRHPWKNCCILQSFGRLKFEGSGLLGCRPVTLGEWFLTFLCNNWDHSPNNTVPHSRRPEPLTGRKITTLCYIIKGALLNTLRTGDTDLRFLHYNCARRMMQICVFNMRLFSLHNTLNYAIHRACLWMVLLTDVYRNLTSLWINL